MAIMGKEMANKDSVNVTNTKIIYIYFFCICFFLNTPILSSHFMGVMSSTILSTLFSFMNFSTMSFIASY